jgi:hypothetical protein
MSWEQTEQRRGVYLLVEEHYLTIGHQGSVHCWNSGIANDIEGASIWCRRRWLGTRSSDNWSGQAVARLTAGSTVGVGVAALKRRM